jgi:hypothetical protein
MRRTRLGFISAVLFAAALSCGGATESGGTAGAGGQPSGGSGGTGQSGGGGEGGTTQVDGATDAPTVIGECTVGNASGCPEGYECGCGGPGPGQCTCHKKCQSPADCAAPNPLCGCGGMASPGICVNECFCLCL